MHRLSNHSQQLARRPPSQHRGADIHGAAAIAEDGAEIYLLVVADADPNARDGGGCVPLHCAAPNNTVAEVAEALFGAGSDPEACGGYGRKPLDYTINAADAALIDPALDAAGADSAGSGDASATRRIRPASPVPRSPCPVPAST